MTYVTQVANSADWSGDTRQRRDGNAKPGNKSENSSRSRGFLAPTRRSALLNRFVEAEILPRLALARAAVTTEQASTQADPTVEQETSDLVRLLMDRDDSSVRGFVETLQRRGATPASLYLGVITNAARRLGELWEDDRADFGVVSISLGRLQQIVRALSPGFQEAAVSRSAHAETILLLPAPGEQHTLGLVILSEFFQREGWHLLGGPARSVHDAVEIVRESWVDVVGFSAGSTSHVDSLTACIRSIRAASRNRYLAVMVGGPLFLQRPDLVIRVGADSTAPDAPAAVRQARGFLALRAAAD